MSKRNLVWFLVFCGAGVMFYCISPMVAQQDSLFSTYKPLVEVDSLINRHYIEPVDQGKRIDGAIRGLLESLDPYSRYIAPDEVETYKRKLKANYVGIGVELGRQDGRLIIVTPFEGSPAARAGILAGDELIGIDGLRIDGLSIFDVNDRLSGQPGTKVEVNIRRQGVDEILSYPLTRQDINVSTIRGFRRINSATWDFTLDPEKQIGYIRVSNFRKSTMDDFNRALDALQKQGLNGLIIDLRFNGGGVLSQAVGMVDRFVQKGLIVSTVSSRRTAKVYNAKAENTFPDIPIVVLVNGYSASGAEIVSGSLQEHKRATVVGTRSYGKGSVQEDILLKTRDAIAHLTTQYYQLPSGRMIHRMASTIETDDWGIIPDVKVDLTPGQIREIQMKRRAVEHITPVTTTTSAPATQPASAPVPPSIWIDPQLQKAIEIVGKAILPAAPGRK